uniref:Testis expressed 10 n=1 Tax=Leptobrachium leishanense TaxID=445787 RepID=A0A8C5QFS9_9ANUR
MTNKRKRQEDFQKVKLKVGKKKPKTANATDTNFASKTIRLSEQLKEDSALPTNRRKLNITDLLSQMHHYNAGVKHSALVGLQELLSLHPSLIDTHISNIIAEVAAVFTDKEPTVRMAAVSLLKYLTPLIPQDKVAPFFPLVSAHLSSAMTHIFVGIQEDSLKILDVLLDEYPDLLIDRSSMLLNNFLELISHQKCSKEVGGEKQSIWTLSINPNRKITSQKWRLNVLGRLKKFLHALVKQAVERFPNNEHMESVFSANKLSDISWTEYANGNQPIKVFSSSEQEKVPFRLRTLVGITGNTDEGLSSTNNLKIFIQSIVPLLIECWIEEFSGDISGNLLNPVSHNLLLLVLSIISLLWKLSEHQDPSQKMDGWLRKCYLKDFKHHFMKRFPYSLCETMTQKKKIKSKDCVLTSNGLDNLLLNLTLCDIMVSLASTETLDEDAQWLAMIQVFVTEKLMYGSNLNCKQLKGLLEVTSRLLNIQRNRATTEKLIHAVYMVYQQKDLLFPVRSMLLNFFSKVYLKEEDICLNLGRSRSKVLSRWLSNLPLQLAQLGTKNPNLSALMIEAIYTAAARSNKELLKSLQNAACQIYDPEDGAFMFLPSESQQLLVQLMYFLPHISSDLLLCLNRCIKEKLPSTFVSMLIGILHVRSSFSCWTYSAQESALNDTDYFSFLFSTLTGFSAEKLTCMQNNKSHQICRTRVSRVSLYLTDQAYFAHQWIVIKAICQSLSSLSARLQCFDILQNAIIKHLGGLVVIPDSTAGAILCAINTLHDRCCIPNDNLNRFLASCCYSIFNFLLTREKDVEHNQKRDPLWGACISLLSMLPNVLKLMLQNLQVSKACQEELPVIAQLLRLLLQNTQLRSHMITNAFLVQQTLQDVMNMKSCEIQEQWLTDLQYCFNVYLSKPPNETAVRMVY